MYVNTNTDNFFMFLFFYWDTDMYLVVISNGAAKAFYYTLFISPIGCYFCLHKQSIWPVANEKRVQYFI